MKTNIKQQVPPVRTHEGALAMRIGAADELRRSVMACMLWEDQFYESGMQIADRIRSLVAQVDPTVCMEIAVEARHAMKLRHAPLWIVREMARLPEHKALVRHTLGIVIERADELAEFLALYWKDDKQQPLSKQVQRGLADAFAKFKEYNFAKYNRDAAVKLRDVLFLTHVKPHDVTEDTEVTVVPSIDKPHYKRGAVLRHDDSVLTRIARDTLETPDTWEVALSGGADKAETFTRLIAERKLGGLALLRNLRNMAQAGVDPGIVQQALLNMSVERILPFRFIAAARAVPQWEHLIEPAMLRCLDGRPKLPGRTVLLVDVSGSMDHLISNKSDLRRVDAACGLAILARELCEDCAILTFSDRVAMVPVRRGFALRDAVITSQPHSGTYLGAAVREAQTLPDVDRLIVISDEQSHDPVPPQLQFEAWMLNVASYQNGVGYGAWHRVDGWSEAVFDYIIAWNNNE